MNRPSLHLLLPTNVFQPQFRLQFHINSFKTSLLYIRPVQMNLNPATTHSYKFTATHDKRPSLQFTAKKPSVNYPIFAFVFCHGRFRFRCDSCLGSIRHLQESLYLRWISFYSLFGIYKNKLNEVVEIFLYDRKK